MFLKTILWPLCSIDFIPIFIFAALIHIWWLHSKNDSKHVGSSIPNFFVVNPPFFPPIFVGKNLHLVVSQNMGTPKSFISRWDVPF